MEEEKKKKGKRKEHKKNWRELYASIDDIKQFLLERVILRHNVITQQTEVHVIEQAPKPPDEATARPEDYVRWLKEWQEWIKPTPTPTPYPSRGEGTDYSNSSDSNYLPSLGEGSGVGYYVLLTDRIENTLYTELKAQKEVRMQDLHSVIESDFVPEYHPFREYLEHLPPWREGDADHIMGLSLSVNVRGDADEQMLFYEYLKKWLVAMVASWVDPGVVNNVMLVLIGEQGSYKTTWFSYLLPPELRRYFYTKTNANRMTKDDLLTLSQYGLVCCEELDTMRPSELNQLKAAMTMPAIDERAAYARHKEHREHIASFCGTGNNVQFLSDTTGNRRWLPFEVSSIDSPRSSPFDYSRRRRWRRSSSTSTSAVRRARSPASSCPYRWRCKSWERTSRRSSRRFCWGVRSRNWVSVLRSLTVYEGTSWCVVPRMRCVPCASRRQRRATGRTGRMGHRFSKTPRVLRAVREEIINSTALTAPSALNMKYNPFISLQVL